MLQLICLWACALLGAGVIGTGAVLLWTWIVETTITYTKLKIEFINFVIARGRAKKASK